MAYNPTTGLVYEAAACEKCGGCCSTLCRRIPANPIGTEKNLVTPPQEVCCWAPNITDAVALSPVGINSDGVHDIFNPSIDNGIKEVLGLTMEWLETDADGRVTVFVPASRILKQCHQCAFVHTSGTWAESSIAGGDEATINALISMGFMKRIAGGYVRVF